MATRQMGREDGIIGTGIPSPTDALVPDEEILTGVVKPPEKSTHFSDILCHFLDANSRTANNFPSIPDRSAV
jgi:hypothetical protein